MTLEISDFSTGAKNMQTEESHSNDKNNHSKNINKNDANLQTAKQTTNTNEVTPINGASLHNLHRN